MQRTRRNDETTKQRPQPRPPPPPRRLLLLLLLLLPTTTTTTTTTTTKTATAPTAVQLHYNHSYSSNYNYTHNDNTTSLQLHLQLHHNFTTTALHYAMLTPLTLTILAPTTTTTTLQIELQYNYNYNYTTQEIDIQKGGKTERHKEKVTERYSEPQPPFNSSVASFCHPCITTTHPLILSVASYLCCAVLLVMSLRIEKMLSMYPFLPWKSSIENGQPCAGRTRPSPSVGSDHEVSSDIPIK